MAVPPKKIYRVLFIDDEIDAMDSLSTDMLRNNLEIIHKSNITEGMKILESDNSIQGLILDGQGFINKEDSRPTRLHLQKAISCKEDIEKKQNRIIPTVAFTGFKEDFKQYIPDIKYFSKDDLANDMFNYLRNEIDRLELNEIIEVNGNNFTAGYEKIIITARYAALLRFLINCRISSKCLKLCNKGCPSCFRTIRQMVDNYESQILEQHRIISGENDSGYKNSLNKRQEYFNLASAYNISQLNGLIRSDKTNLIKEINNKYKKGNISYGFKNSILLTKILAPTNEEYPYFGILLNNESVKFIDTK
ncbi:MAG: hypothetical protein CMD65_02355 [Gammaproteobacteria bacterium]|nr:hypothetical protein [Gammaproteobacteria bacterium]|tara:strand:- start:305 stop:1222 length:918 start_codon:yes stop_codon:yes gene_type:complete